MKREKLYDAMTDIRDDLVTGAEKQYAQRNKKYHRRWRRAIAAVLVLAVLGGVILSPDNSVLVTRACAVALAEYPEMANFPKTDVGPGYDAWRASRNLQSRPEGHADGLEEFFTATMQEFLVDAGNGNKVYSPVNVYLALAMLAELTEGNSRKQLLDLLGYDDMNDLRRQANDIWNANYCDDGKTIRVLGSSLWLNEDIEFEQSTLDTLAGTYYASTYQGKMGSNKLNNALRKWLNEHTGGRLSGQVDKVELEADIIMALAATLYYQAKWDSEFSESNTKPDTFHAPGGDITVDFMNKERTKGYYYWGEHFGAASVPLENAGDMWFILPDEDVTVEKLLADEETMAFLQQGSDWENSKHLMINLSVPKFDVMGENDLISGLMNLGVTDVFDWTQADFSPLLKGDLEAKYLPYVNQILHDARVTIDEEGVAAVAYTMISMRAGAAAPPDDEIDFILDRPFLFVITGADDVPLFVGVVNQP